MLLYFTCITTKWVAIDIEPNSEKSSEKIVRLKKQKIAWKKEEQVER